MSTFRMYYVYYRFQFQMLKKMVFFLSLASVTLSSPDQATNKVNPRKKYFNHGPDHEAGLDPKIGHGIAPNLEPRYSPAVQQESIPEVKDFLSLSGRIQALSSL